MADLFPAHFSSSIFAAPNHHALVARHLQPHQHPCMTAWLRLQGSLTLAVPQGTVCSGNQEALESCMQCSPARSGAPRSPFIAAA